MSSIVLYQKASSLNATLSKKQSEIEKRKELIQQMPTSEAVQAKNQLKESKIDRQIEGYKTTLDSKLEYYRKEISMSEQKMEKKVQEARDAMERKVKDAEKEFENYRTYCHTQMNLLEQKYETTIKTLEGSKETVSVSVADDKILKRLEIEVKQLQEEYNQAIARAEAESNAEHRARVRDAQEMAMLEDQKRREHEYFLAERARQEEQMMKQREEQRKEEKRQEREQQIQQIMKQNNVSYEVACDVFKTQNHASKDNVIAVVNQMKQQEALKERDKQMTQIRVEYPQYRKILIEIYTDQEYTNKLLRLPKEKVVEFLETMKPLIEALQKFEDDETLLDEKHQGMFDNLSLDTKLECIKLKDKQKRYKFIEKNNKTRVEKINDNLGCV